MIWIVEKYDQLKSITERVKGSSLYSLVFIKFNGVSKELVFTPSFYEQHNLIKFCSLQSEEKKLINMLHLLYVK